MKFLFKSQGANAPCDFLWARARARGIMYSHPVALCATPPAHRTTHANYVCAGPGGGGGHSGVVPFGNIVFYYCDHPGTTCHPSAEGNFSPRRYVATFPPLEGWAQPGVVRELKNPHLIPILCHSRAGGNDRGVRANARRHIALDCHSRTPTFSTLA